MAKLGRLRVEGLDLRSLSAFRILVGLNVIYNLFKYRLHSVELFYTEEGLLATDTFREFYGDLFSLMKVFPSVGFIYFFFGLTLVLAILYVLGIGIKIIAPLLFFCFANIITINPWTVHAVEFLIEASLFWSIFLPVDHYFTLKKNKKPAPPSAKVRNVAVFAFLTQVFFVYVTSGLTKSGEYWQEGVAVWSVMDDRMHASYLAAWFQNHPGLCEILNYGTIVVEVLIGLVLFSPVWNQKLRLAAAIAIPCLHFGLATGMNVGPFHWITLAFAVAIIPSFVWARFYPIKVTKKSKKNTKQTSQVPPITLWLRRATNVFIIIMLLGITIQNLKKWERDSYIASFVNAFPPLNSLAEVELPRPNIFIGITQQPWWTFSPNPHEQMGCLVVLGRDVNQNSYNLLTGELFSVDQDAEGVITFSDEPYNHFTHTRFVFAWYVRRYRTQIPQSIIDRWVAYEMEQYNKAYPDQQVVEAKMFFFSNKTSLTNGQVSRERSFFPVQ